MHITKGGISGSKRASLAMQKVAFSDAKCHLSYYKGKALYNYRFTFQLPLHLQYEA